MSKWIFDIEQNTEEWVQIKVGKFSASKAGALMMDKKNKGYKDLISKIAEERITGQLCENDSFRGNWATNRGHELEPIARNDFELRTFNVVNLVGVVLLDDWTLCSPDGYIDKKTLHQIKCPIFSTQKEYLLKSKNGENWVKKEYYLQSQFELFVTGADTQVFTSYHPNLRALDIVIERDEVVINEIKQRLNEAKKEVQNEINKILEL